VFIPLFLGGELESLNIPNWKRPSDIHHKSPPRERVTPAARGTESPRALIPEQRLRIGSRGHLPAPIIRIPTVDHCQHLLLLFGERIGKAQHLDCESDCGLRFFGPYRRQNVAQ
jgi:hypothetical protein